MQTLSSQVLLKCSHILCFAILAVQCPGMARATETQSVAAERASHHPYEPSLGSTIAKFAAGSIGTGLAIALTFETSEALERQGSGRKEDLFLPVVALGATSGLFLPSLGIYYTGELFGEKGNLMTTAFGTSVGYAVGFGALYLGLITSAFYPELERFSAPYLTLCALAPAAVGTWAFHHSVERNFQLSVGLTRLGAELAPNFRVEF